MLILCTDLRGVVEEHLVPADICPALDEASDRETDFDSVFSVGESLTTTDSSLGIPGTRYISIKEVTSVLLSHLELRSLYATAISRVDEKKCRAHFKGFLKAYAKSLKEEAGDHLETTTATFIESMAGRVSDEIRRAIVSPDGIVQLEEGPSKQILENQLATIKAQGDEKRGDARLEFAIGQATEDQTQTENCDDISDPEDNTTFELIENLKARLPLLCF